MEVYARELIPELVAAAPHAHFTAFINREAAQAGGGPWGDLIPAVTVPVSARKRIQWVRGEQLLLPPLAADAGVDLLHSLGGTAPGWGRFQRVASIHDLNYRIVPEAHLGLLGLGMRILVPLAARRSHRIIVDAASTRRDLRDHLQIAAGKVDVVPLGVRHDANAPALSESETRAWLGAGDHPIVLSVSAKRPHKNLARLIGALALIDRAQRPLLALPGYPTSYEAELRQRAEALGVGTDVRFLAWVDSRQLEGLYRTAACFVFPSLYEGFGLPVLEAMSRGVPVACSGRGSLDEVAGDAALRFDPESEAEIAAAIERLLGDRSERHRLRTAGLERARAFSWAKAGAGTVACYERALATRRPPTGR